MKVLELQNACLDALERGDKFICLVTKSTRLCGRCGPIGQLRCVNANGEKVVAFKAQSVLDFIDRELDRRGTVD